MNFYFRRAMRVMLAASLLCLTQTLFAQTRDFNKPLGELTSHTFSNNELVLNTSAGRARITWYSPTIVRVQVTQTESFNDFSYAVIASPVTSGATLKEDADAFHLTTDSLEVVITKRPVRFTMRTRKGDVINQDDPAFGTSWLGEEVTTYKSLQDGERFIGLGEKTGNLDRRGQACTNWNTDYFGYPLTADAIYLTTPFYVGLHHGLQYGIFMDNSSKSNFNFGASNNRFSAFTAEEGEMNYYFIYHTSVSRIIESYTHLTGRMQMPPLWSLGLQQSRYSYYPAAEVIDIARNFRDRSIPADVIYLDIHYMDKYKIFSWDKARFPDPKKMTDELKSMGFHTAVILDPGIKVEKNYEPYEDGLKKDVFVKYPDKTYYTGEVWPGWCHFPDFTKPSVRIWWETKFNGYVNDGVEGFWNDMNEPATWGQSSPNLIEFDFDGHRATHRTARNVYGLNMTRSTFDGTRKLLNGKRPFLLTRSGFSGIQRYSAVWTGDNVSSDEHMLLGVRLVNSMGVAGVPVTGMDVGGFTGGGSEKLFARWMTLGAFTPFYRVHAKDNSRAQEPWAYGEQIETIAKNYVGFRYKLIPYLYSTFYEASVNGLPVSRTLAINYPHEAAVYELQYQNQFLFGPSLLVAPGESTRDYYKVFLPEGEWYDLYDDKHFVGSQEIVADAALDHLPVFVKGSSIIPMQSLVQHLTEQPTDTLNIHVYKGSAKSSFVYYEDDGATYDYQNKIFYKRTIFFSPKEKSLTFGNVDGSWTSKFKNIRVIFHGFEDLRNKLSMKGAKVRAVNGNISMLADGRSNNVQIAVVKNLVGEFGLSWR